MMIALNKLAYLINTQYVRGLATRPYPSNEVLIQSFTVPPQSASSLASNTDTSKPSNLLFSAVPL